MSDPRRRELKTTFDLAADIYHTARPAYPEQIFDDFVEMTGLRAGSSVLEIGCGTGRATVPLAKRGFRIVGVELGENLAAVARRNLEGYPDVRVVSAPFEEWDPAAEQFDAVFAAQAWHWLDPDVRFVKVAAVLKEGGVLAVLDAEHAFPNDFDPFFNEIQKVYDEISQDGPSHDVWPPPPPEDVEDMREDFESGGRFGDFQSRRYVWDVMYTAEAYIDLLNTFSDHIASTPEQREYLYGKVRELIVGRSDPRVRRHWLAILNLARRLR
jgi:SAM-dependent methyltransferase